MKTNTIIQYEYLEIDEISLIHTIKQIWLNQGKKLKDMKEIQLYIKPAELTAYYVINSAITGSIALQ